MAHDIRRTLDEIHMAACYGTEEDPSAAADSLRLIGDLARKALAEIGSAQAEPKLSEPSEAMVDAAIRAMDDVYAHPAAQRPEINEQDRVAMRAALLAAMAEGVK